MRSKLSFSSTWMCAKSLVERCWPSSKTICSARSTRSATSPVALLPQPDDLLARTDEPAERRHLLDDPRVVLDVRRRRDERRQLGDAPLAARGLELAALLELVDERDRVDRLALRPQRERGAVHLRVALAVEVPRVEDLADRPDGDRREEHRAEHGLLGLEVLRRDDGAQALPDALELDVGRLGLAHGPGVKPSSRAASNRSGTHPRAGRTEHMFPVIPACGRPCRQAAAKLSNPETGAPSANFRMFPTRAVDRRDSLLRCGAREHERPQEPGEAQRPGRRQVQARPRGTTAFRGCTCSSRRRRGSSTSARRRLRIRAFDCA